MTCTLGDSSPISSRKQRAAGRLGEAPVLLADRAREGAALVAEELALEDRLGDGGAVDGDERPARARRPLVDVAREELLARAALAEDEHRRLTGRGLGRDVDDAAERRRAAHDLAVREALDLVLERAVLRDEPLPLGRLADALDDGDPLERLLDEVVRAVAHRVDRGLHRSVRGHQHDLDVGRDLLDGAQELEPGRPGHHQIRQDDVHAVRSYELEGTLRVRSRQRPHPLAQEDLFEGLDVGALVVDHENGDRIGRRLGEGRLGRRHVRESALLRRDGEARSFCQHG